MHFVVIYNLCFSFSHEYPQGRAGGHPVWDWSTLFLHHGEMFNIFTSLVKELPGIHFYEDADHGPDITLLIPLAAVEDDFRSPVLPSVDYRVMLLLIICGTSKVNDLDRLIQRSKPDFLLEPSLPHLHLFGCGHFSACASVIRIAKLSFGF